MSIVINDVSPRVHYTAVHGDITFIVPFEWFQNEELKVWVNGVLATYDNPPLDLNHYSTIGEGITGGGSITFGGHRFQGDKIVIIRDMPIARITDLPTSGVFPVESLNQHLDASIAMVQQTEVNVQKRSLILVDHDEPVEINELPLLADRAGKLLSFDDNGHPATDVSFDDIQEAVNDAQAAAEAAEDSAEAAAGSAADAASSASDASDSASQAAGSVSDLVSQGSVPLYATVIGCMGTTLPADITAMRVNGYHAVGDGGDGLWVKAGSPPVHNAKFQSGDGAWWIPPKGPLNVKRLGAKGDGVADETAAIQAAIDFQMYHGGESEVYLPGGNYSVSDTLHLGYGNDFKSVVLVGAGLKYGTYDGANGTVILAQFADRPLLVVQGGRSTTIKDLSLHYLPYFDYISTRNMGSSAGSTTIDDTVVDNWNDPTMPPTADSRHAPFAAIAIDPYSGAKKTAKTITAITQANPGVVTSTAHGFVTNEVVLMTVAGMTQLNGNYYRVTLINANSYSLKTWDTGLPIDTTSFGTFTSGTAISPAYPTVSYPTWTGIATQYGKNFSQDTMIDGVYIAGFICAVVVQPGDSDGNGDYTRLRRCYIEKCKWGVSIGNAQSRNVGIYDSIHARIYAVLTSNKHGRQSGKFGGPIVNMSIAGGAINVFEFGSVYPSPVVFTNFYSEGLYKIGDIQSTNTIERGYLFDGCQFDFSHELAPQRGIPPSVITGAATHPTLIVFRNCHFDNFGKACSFYSSSVSFEACTFSPATPTLDYEKFALNLLAGGAVTWQLRPGAHSRIKYTPYNLSTGSLHTATGDTAFANNCGRTFCVPMHVEQVRGSNEPTDRMDPPKVTVTGFAKAGWAVPATLVDRVLTFTFSSRGDTTFMAAGPLPGDVLWDGETGSVFFVSARTGLTVTAILQNNYYNTTVGSGIFAGYRTPINPNVGTLYCRPSRIYTPQFYLRGDLTTSSAVIANAARDDNNSSFLTTDLAVGDQLLVSVQTDAFISELASVIAALDTTAKTITIVASGSTRTVVRRRLDYFIRPGPANV